MHAGASDRALMVSSEGSVRRVFQLRSIANLDSSRFPDDQRVFEYSISGPLD